MSESELFSGMSNSDCAKIAFSAKSRVFSRHDVIFNEGEPVRSIMLILSGCVKLTQLGRDGSEVILWMKSRGDIAGVTSLSLCGAHTYSAYVVQTCNAMVWHAAKFEAYLDEFPSMRRNLGGILSSRLTELEHRFREVATQKVEKRIANILVRLVKKVGIPVQGGVYIALSRAELAQMTGTTLFSVSRLMSEWEQQGLVTPRREALLVRDVPKLSGISGNEPSE